MVSRVSKVVSVAQVTAMGMDIFDACDPGTETVDLSKLEIDKNFARRLEHNKMREALHRLEQLKKQGRAGASDDSDEDEDDDDVDLGVSSKEELEYIRALNIIKKKDPILKNQDLKLFPSVEEEGENKPLVARKDKPLYLKDVNARHLLDHGPEFEDEPLKHDSKIYKKEQAVSIREFMEAEKAAMGESEDEDFLKQKEKDGGEAEVDVAEIAEGLDEFFGKDDDLDENEKFLKEYLREKKWVDREKGREISVDVDVSEDENELERQDQYEASFNFRYQEPDQEDRVLGHSRVTDGSVRKKTSSRKAQRKSKEERMAQAEFERKEELKHLKNLKKKEIQEKLEKIRAIAGIGNGGNCKLDAEDLEEDFDPEEYDQKMREMFGLEYYGEEDVDPGFGSDADIDMEKPDFDKEDELLGLAKGWEVSGSKDGFAATREKVLKQKEKEEELMEEPQKEEGKRKRKRKISLKEKVELDKELEEYYKLDYEDTIGDLKTRFKYRTVEANKYDLRPEEILMADDKDLNQYVSIKKLAPYREEEWKVTTHQKKKKSLILQGDPSKISKKHTRNGGQSSLKAEMNSRNEPNDISRRARRRHRLAELKPTWERLRAYGKIQSKPQKHR